MKLTIDTKEKTIVVDNLTSLGELMEYLSSLPDWKEYKLVEKDPSWKADPNTWTIDPYKSFPQPAPWNTPTTVDPLYGKFPITSSFVIYDNVKYDLNYTA